MILPERLFSRGICFRFGNEAPLHRRLFRTAHGQANDLLHTILERLLEELSFEAPEMKMGSVEVNGEYVKQRLSDVAENEDLSRFIL